MLDAPSWSSHEILAGSSQAQLRGGPPAQARLLLARDYVAPFGVGALLVAELLYLTIRFDSQVLDQAPSAWLRLLAAAPQYLQIAMTVAVVGLLLGGRRLIGPAIGARGFRRTRLTGLAIHALGLLAFLEVSEVVFDPERVHSIRPGGRSPGWSAASSRSAAGSSR